jgi:hypothetical protein
MSTCDCGKHNHAKQAISSKDAFSSVAFWQMMVFVVLICFVWANEALDLPHRVFGTDPDGLNIYRGFLLSAAIITAAIIAVGHTYERQKAVLQKMLMTCVYCHRVMHDDGSWEHVEEYFLRAYPMDMERGACPDCESMLSVAGSKGEEHAKPSQDMKNS